MCLKIERIKNGVKKEKRNEWSSIKGMIKTRNEVKGNKKKEYGKIIRKVKNNVSQMRKTV